MNSPPRIEPINEGERQWIEANLRVSRSFVAAYAGEQVVEGAPSPLALERAWDAWLESWESEPAESRDDPNPIINAVGIAVGQLLVSELGLAWVVATDEYGTEIAVYGNPGDVLVFPPNLVGKRFESRTTGFIVSIVDQLRADIRRMQETRH
jgi:Domain of unknown function (DUF3806)